ncbi:MAG: type II toxin-antitoxin system ParD family antitoxin [Nitrosomonas sp.]|uniref:type II toxin-antitoxin system ParD family antitoxin n=1 Tax=Nitrosomonas sp. TaxID=42353 RepID=UPI001D826B4B|nr:type II toxin-antitoxin system ParD family antitoxin [Nitrosomonas sp.]MCB1976913.1 type II toxin-antitoxin system ParD family antitoxin [Nitrosomonas sp.]MDR4515651.1 type II toxin-antitoxin system ParD family antitoxin [Nitrosomonas sp.]
MAGTTKPVSFTLGERDIEFLTNMVEKGRFGNRTEVVRAGLRLLEDYENNEKIKRLRALIAEGEADIEAGRITEFNNAQELESSITS